MSETRALAVNGHATQAIASQDDWNQQRIDVIKRTFAKGVTNDELDLFIAVCRRTGLSPEAKQIYAITRWDKRENCKVMTVQLAIDGLRLIAQRSGLYAGSETHWCGPDGVWVDVWTDLKNPPFAARTTVWRVGVARPFVAVCRFASYVQDTQFWRDSPDNQIAKCSEGLALRKGFPAELAGYRQVAPEMDQGGDRIIDRVTGEIIGPADDDDDAFERAAAEYEATRQAAPEQPYERAPHVEETLADMSAILEGSQQEDAARASIDSMHLQKAERDTNAAFDALGSATDTEGVLHSAEHQAALAEVVELLAACKEAGINQAPPHPQATEMAVTSWIAATKRRLNAQRAPARGAR